MPSLGDFDPNQHHDTYEPLPAGDYLVMITESSIDQKDDGGQFVKVTMEVMQPEQYYGRKAFANFTLQHANPKAVEVGRRILATLCRAVGVMAPRETEELHGIPFCVRLAVEQWGDGSLHNEVKAYWSTQSQAPPQAKSKAKPAQQPMGNPQYQPPRPGPAPAWQPPAQQQRPQAPQQPQYGPPVGQRPAMPPQGQQWQPSQSAGPWQQQPPQQAYQPPVQAPAPAAPVGQPPWAQHPQAPQQPAPEQVQYDADVNEIPF